MAQGADTTIGYARGSLWNTAVTVDAANRGLLVNDWTAPSGVGPLIYSNSLTGSGGRSNAMRGPVKLNFTVNSELRYTGLEHLFAMIMGTAGPPTTSDGTARTHIFQLANSVDGLYDTVALAKVGPPATPGLPIWEYPSVKWGGVTITIPADGLVTLAVPAIASSCKPLTGQVNTALGAVTYRTKALNALGVHAKWRVNLASAAALSDTDCYHPRQLTVEFIRPLDSDFVFACGTTGAVQPEPYYTDFFSVVVRPEFPVYGPGTLQVNNVFLTAALNETPLKMDLTLTSPQLAGAATVPYSWLFEFPNVVVADPQMPVNGPGAIPHTVELSCLEATAAPLGMTGLTRAFRATNVSQMLTDALLNP